jgi:hypothetical protein
MNQRRFDRSTTCQTSHPTIDASVLLTPIGHAAVPPFAASRKRYASSAARHIPRLRATSRRQPPRTHIALDKSNGSPGARLACLLRSLLSQAPSPVRSRSSGRVRRVRSSLEAQARLERSQASTVRRVYSQWGRCSEPSLRQLRRSSSGGIRGWLARPHHSTRHDLHSCMTPPVGCYR